MPKFSRRLLVRSIPLLLLFFGVGLLPGPNVANAEPIGDVLTTIQRPLLNIPAIVTPGQTFEISCDADPAATGWSAELRHGPTVVPLAITGASYDASTLWWTMNAELPGSLLHELYDLRVAAGGGIDDTTWNAVQVIDAFKIDWYFVHITDPHLPDHTFSSSGGVPADSTEMDDLRAVIDDINLLRPEFVLLTGDLVNEGELEDYLEWRAYTRSQRLLAELEVPVYLVAGNHDLGGWDSTPPSDGTARRDWWRFFGWDRLDNPPPGAPEYTQNYSFDYGPVHFVGLEAYINYDSWRYSIYGGESFTNAQLDWLDDDLAAASSSSAQVLFHHRDFNYQLNLSSLGVEMSLSGHIHSDDGSLSSTPYDLSTNNTCDGERAYRLVRVSGSSLQPRPTMEAG
ncbi:MAG: metallophosphoesterase, partial [bacterium]